MKIEDLKRIVDAICELHPTAKVDFVHPYRRGQKITSRLSTISGYHILSADRASGSVARFQIDHARIESLEDAP